MAAVAAVAPALDVNNVLVNGVHLHACGCAMLAATFAGSLGGFALQWVRPAPNGDGFFDFIIAASASSSASPSLRAQVAALQTERAAIEQELAASADTVSQTLYAVSDTGSSASSTFLGTPLGQNANVNSVTDGTTDDIAATVAAVAPALDVNNILVNGVHLHACGCAMLAATFGGQTRWVRPAGNATNVVCRAAALAALLTWVRPAPNGDGFFDFIISQAPTAPPPPPPHVNAAADDGAVDPAVLVAQLAALHAQVGALQTERAAIQQELVSGTWQDRTRQTRN
ncbi:hypothetical protein DFJ73DRAFT_906858 [Zopfochytrium polystomum]|nr:hypothetical protein DFJ73DRAFT_906858 [Zopfochytrium polystomum]